MLRSSLITSVLLVFVNVGVSLSLDMHGHVQSPLYPNPYPDNIHKQWDLEVPTGYQLQINFNYLDIEPSLNCFYDYLMVLHGRNVLGKFCGRNSTDPHHPANKPIISPSNRLQLVFVTDETNSEKHLGFSTFYQAIDIDECSSTSLDDSDPHCSQICLNTLGSYLCTCYHGYRLRGDQYTCVLDCGGGVFKELEGVLSSPGYPKSAPLGQNCIYTISVPPGFQITLNFSDNFQIEHIQHQQSVCLFHWLKISVPGQTPEMFCGDKSPGIIPTNSHLVDLEFHTDGAGESRGFSLQYTTNRVECKLERQITNGKITPDFPKYFYRDYIYIRCDTGYKLMKEGKEIDSFKTMCQENGMWHLSLPQCQILDCGEPKGLRNGAIQFISGSKNEYKSVIQYHCNEPFYTFNQANEVSFTCAADRKWRADKNIDEIPHCYSVCGRRNVSLSGRGRVWGGALAGKGMFPWQVFLFTSGRGGAIVIGEKWLLTAAHNLYQISKEAVKVYVGSNNVTELIKTNPLPIKSLHVHPEFKKSDYNNDIALIKLESPITFNQNVMPVCLPVHDGQMGNTGTVSGFGLTEKHNIADQLRYVSLPIVDQQVCQQSLTEARRTIKDVYPLTENMFCAGLPEGGNDTCSGDSGSAFVINNNDVFHVTGIVSWGIDCGKPGKYGVYTRVTQYKDWIQKTMEENE